MQTLQSVEHAFAPDAIEPSHTRPAFGPELHAQAPFTHVSAVVQLEPPLDDDDDDGAGGGGAGGGGAGGGGTGGGGVVAVPVLPPLPVQVEHLTEHALAPVVIEPSHVAPLFAPPVHVHVPFTH